jgi:hypothetical protein
MAAPAESGGPWPLAAPINPFRRLGATLPATGALGRPHCPQSRRSIKILVSRPLGVAH